MTIGEVLKNHRVTQQMSQEEVAKKNFSDPHIDLKLGNRQDGTRQFEFIETEYPLWVQCR